MRDDQFGAAVGNHIKRFIPPEMPVDRHDIGTEQSRAHRDFEKDGIVAQKYCNSVSGTYAHCRQPGGDLRCPDVNGLAVKHRCAADYRRRHVSATTAMPANVVAPP